MDRCNKICGHVAPLSLFIYARVYCVVFVGGCHKLNSLRIHIYVCAMYIIIRSFVVVVVVIGVVSWDGDYCFLIFVCNALVKWILWIFIVTGRGEGKEGGGEALMRTIHEDVGPIIAHFIIIINPHLHLLLL